VNIMFIASECAPFCKTGGLADVVGSLPKALKKLGANPIIVIEWCAVDKVKLNGDIPVYLIEFDKYFNREGLYHDNNFKDYGDNARRFSFLTRAGLQLCKDIGYKPDIVHSHDWQSSLAGAYLKIWHWDDPILGQAASILTIHNCAYQGVYPKEDYYYAGLQEANFTEDKFESFGAFNMLKGGIYFSDIVNTVSPTYAREISSPFGGFGMAPYLSNKGDRFLGILNGVDYDEWNPETDKLIPSNYSSTNLKGKIECKLALQKEMLLEQKYEIPIIGVVSRFVHQKGLDLLAEAIEGIINNMIVQFAILGAGEKYLEEFYYKLPAKYPGKIGSYIGYSNKLAHMIEAGSDFFIMPSLYEPCGLNQIYSLKYGTLPIVRATGGLDDTVEQYDEATGDGTGFKFYEASARAIYYTVGWAVSTFYDRKDHLKKMIKNAMAKDFSWEKSAKEYIKAYEKAIAIKKGM
jgi:starch synthase